ncbi:HNH endonuclease signature motif containing protein [Hymenobacter sp. ASUV-10]|uniref:HNH endonuclease signature motif containing protein n=1 Tax=Hymenobacter aranciens TaxID=3063996 RepID=A0ABT9B8G6_9BACT|nr:HNH endonuclease signature motif containing protein [Hymenobacter sp. ASUV-10]MDO7874560.1 HNH endonuclease signature motif containing protein [Hymenobacter sp. ASUV-10]
MEVIKNFGILTSIAWNSNGWTKDPSAADLAKAKYDFVKENAHEHESINFGHEIYPAEEDGSYIGYSPILNRTPDKENSKYVSAIFFLSSDYRHQNRKCIVGLYGFPEIGWAQREAKHPIFKTYDGGNIRAHVDNIIYFQNPVVIDDRSVIDDKLLPIGKLISKQGFNYLHSDNVFNILLAAVRLNPANTKLATLVRKFPTDIDFFNELIDGGEAHDFLENKEADSLAGIAELERKMQKLRPQVKERVSAFIERGAIAGKVKSLTGHKCLMCEALGLNPIGFLKRDGVPYVETHHVTPVSGLTVGGLGLANIITLCANHHRQMHYGNTELISQTKTLFVFSIDGSKVEISKIRVS